MPKRLSMKTKVSRVLATEPAPPQLLPTEAAAPKEARPARAPVDATALEAAQARIKELEDGLRYAVAFIPKQARSRNEWIAAEKCRALLRLPQ